MGHFPSNPWGKWKQVKLGNIFNWVKVKIKHQNVRGMTKSVCRKIFVIAMDCMSLFPLNFSSSFFWLLFCFFVFFQSSIKKKQFYLFIYGCAGSSLLWWAFSSYGKQGLHSSWGALASHSGGFSYCSTWALEHGGFRSCSVRALELRHTGLAALQHVRS